MSHYDQLQYSTGFYHNTCCVFVGGLTYNFKEVLREAGGIWQSRERRWIFLSEDAMDVVRKRIIRVLDERVAVEKAVRNAIMDSESLKREWETSHSYMRQRVHEELEDADYKHPWICCRACEVIHWQRQVTKCAVHNTRIRGQGADVRPANPIDWPGSGQCDCGSVCIRCAK